MSAARRFTLLLLGGVWSAAWGDGIIIPEPPVQRLAVRYHRVAVTIQDQAAHTDIDQVFLNRMPFDTEGTYIFPLPEDASFSAYSMFVDGTPLTAEVLDAEEARRIYEEIVRQRIDPALLEYVGRGAYRARIFPIPAEGEKRVQLAYEEVLRRDADIVRYLYPLSTEKFSSEPLEEVSVSVTIRSATPIKAIYSPSHQIAVERSGEHEARVIYADEEVTPQEDFVLYYSVDPEEVDVSLLAYRSPDEDLAYYMLLAAPQVDSSEGRVIPKRLIFALDRSGSMAGEQMAQAREALRFCVQHLRDADQANVVDYGTTVESFADTTVPVGDATRAALLAYIDRLEAMGGTYIHGALMESLGMLRGDGLAEMLVFLTDGKPTVGERDVEKILSDVAQANQGRARIFVFGVGHEVNTHLLDRLASQNGGTSTYVQPAEDLEVAVSSFYTKVSSPVLEDVELQLVGGRISDAYPPELPDLFRGSQIVQLGRLEGVGPWTVRLAGRVAGEEYAFEQAVETTASGPSFLPRLWATRKVGYLLDQIRLYGEDPELVEAIVALSQRYGIITPYTSFLIVEDEPSAPGLVDETFRADSGAGAVHTSEAVRGYAGADNTAGVRSEEVRYVGERTFYLRHGYWEDSQHPEGRPTRDYTFGSQRYFELLASRPQLGRYMALGTRVIFTWEGQSYRVHEAATGVETQGSSVTPRRPTLEQNHPNPFNASTEIRFTLPRETQVELAVYDLAGQRVATLVDRVLAAGAHGVVWDGQGSGEAPLGSGTYACRLRADGEQAARKLVLLK